MGSKLSKRKTSKTVRTTQMETKKSKEKTSKTHGKSKNKTLIDRQSAAPSKIQIQHATDADPLPLKNENRPEYMLETVRAWRREDMYKTKSMKAVEEKILSEDCVCVIGIPGAGKSTAVYHAALSLERKGFNIYIIDDPIEILQYYDKSEKQVFVKDDVLGLYSLCQNNIEKWEKYNERIRHILGSNTKLLVTLRVQLFQSPRVNDRNIVFMNKKGNVVDFSMPELKLGLFDMMGMLTHCMLLNRFERDSIDRVVKQVWGFTEKEMTKMTEENRKHISSRYSAGVEFSQCFPLLCKVFVNNDFVRLKPKEFFTNPFPALTNVFNNIKSDNKQQFCALVLCAVFNGNLNDDMFSAIFDLNEKDIEIRNVIMTSFDLEGLGNLRQIKSALDSLIDVYVLRVGDSYQMSHRVFHDIVTYLYNDPLFVFKYGTSEFIRDRVRLNKDIHHHDPYIVVYSDNKNIKRLTDRLFSDLESDPFIGARFIVNHPDIDDDRLIHHLRTKFGRREPTGKNMIDALFKQCMLTVMYNIDLYIYGDVTQYKLIEMCILLGVDCNMLIGHDYPLHISVMTGNVQLTKLLLDNGADKHKDNILGLSVRQKVHKFTRFNQVKIIELLRQSPEHEVFGNLHNVLSTSTTSDDYEKYSLNRKGTNLRRYFCSNINYTK